MSNGKKKVLFFSNIIAPYNIPLFNKLSTLLNNNILFIFDQVKEFDRNWKIIENNLHFDFSVKNSYNIKRSITTGNNVKTKSTFYFPFYIFKNIWLYKPSVVLSIEFGLRTLFCLLMCKITGAKFLIISDVTCFTESNIGSFKKVIRKLIVSLSNGAIARSYAAKEYLLSLGFASEKIFVAPYAIDDNKLTDTNDMSPIAQKVKTIKDGFQEKFCFIYSGQFIHRKGLDILINTINKLESKVKESIIIFLAGGTNEDLKKIDLSYDQNLFFPLGFISNQDLNCLYAMCDCFILPTRADTWALVANEAVVAGCPVLISKYAGSAGELIEDGISGVVFDPLNEEDFIQKINYCINNKSQLSLYADKAKQKLREYNNDVSAERISTAINQLQTQ